MARLAKRKEDLPYVAPQYAACAAARAADVQMTLPGIPIPIRVRFTGTGTAVLPAELTHKIFDPQDPTAEVRFDWYQNTFVGRHWLLGEFRAELQRDVASTGSLKASTDGLEFGNATLNENEFFFDFTFRRFPGMVLRNREPIRNDAVVSAIPPVGSVFRLPAGSVKTAVDISRGDRVVGGTIAFDQCEVTVYPTRNVDVALVRTERVRPDAYRVVTRIGNPTASEATFAYFSVVHFDEVDVGDDYGFVLLKPGATQEVTYEVRSRIPDRVVTIPFFAALYMPALLQGAGVVDIALEF